MNMEIDEKPQYPSTFDGLRRLVQHLRGPAGCPWDREQTSTSMKRHLLEECYELVEAIDESDTAKLVEELGDVLFHLAFQIQLGSEEGAFSEDQVFRAANDKLTRRHPHVFSDAIVTDACEVVSNWDAIKRNERAGTERSALDGVPKGLSALSHAQVIQERAARAGFNWEEVLGVMEKVKEEMEELQIAQSPEEREAEVGDILFSIVNLSRWLGVDAEGALRGTDIRFRKRFAFMEQLSRERGLSFDGLTLAEKETLWQEAKGLVG